MSFKEGCEITAPLPGGSSAQKLPTVIFSVSATTTGYSDVGTHETRNAGNTVSQESDNRNADDDGDQHDGEPQNSADESLLEGEDEALRLQMKEMGLPCQFASASIPGEADGAGAKRKRKAKPRTSQVGASDLIPASAPRTRSFRRLADMKQHIFRTRVRAAMVAAEIERGDGGGGIRHRWAYSTAEEGTGAEGGMYGPFSVLEMLVWVSAGYFLGEDCQVRLAIVGEDGERGVRIGVEGVHDLVALLVVGRDVSERGRERGAGEEEAAAAAASVGGLEEAVAAEERKWAAFWRERGEGVECRVTEGGGIHIKFEEEGGEEKGVEEEEEEKEDGASREAEGREEGREEGEGSSGEGGDGEEGEREASGEGGAGGGGKRGRGRERGSWRYSDLFGMEDGEQAWGSEELREHGEVRGEPEEAGAVRGAAEEEQGEAGAACGEGEVDEEIAKYWRDRHTLFSKFDLGVRLDRESWYSVTPEALARHHAERMRGGREAGEAGGAMVVVDAFCGAGGNAIQLALQGPRVSVVAVDLDATKLALARHNARIYGVLPRIRFIHGDFLEVAEGLRGQADAVLVSPPWGGPSYAVREVFDLRQMDVDGLAAFHAAAKISGGAVAMFLPRSCNVAQLAALAAGPGGGGRVEVEKNLLNGRLKALTAYFGPLAAQP